MPLLWPSSSSCVRYIAALGNSFLQHGSVQLSARSFTSTRTERNISGRLFMLLACLGLRHIVVYRYRILYWPGIARQPQNREVVLPFAGGDFFVFVRLLFVPAWSYKTVGTLVLFVYGTFCGMAWKYSSQCHNQNGPAFEMGSFARMCAFFPDLEF